MTNQDLREALTKALALLTQYHVALLKHRPDSYVIEPLIRDLIELRKLATQGELR